MFLLELFCFIGFTLLIAIGYKNNNRNVMLVASLLLLVGFAGPDFMNGFFAGYENVVDS